MMDNNTNNLNSPLILVIDDDDAARLMIRESLEQAKFNVVEAHNGLVGLNKFNEQQPDLILSDVMMPHMDGFQLCKEIRKLTSGAHIPILTMTALEDYESINQAYEAGATDFITKPINYLLLTHRLQYMLRSKSIADDLLTSGRRLANAQRLARIGHWEMCVDTGRMRCSEELAKLLGFSDGSSIDSMDLFLRNIVESDRPRFVSSFLESKEHKTGFTLEQQMLTKEGVLIHVINFAKYEVDPTTGEDVLIGATQDITERKRIEKQVQHLSYFDKLTGLPNRQHFIRSLKQALSITTRKKRHLSVLRLNLDRFERVNSSLGHEVGNKVLIKVKDRLLDCLRKSDVLTQVEKGSSSKLAHLGGDDFVMLIPEISNMEDAAIVARRIISVLNRPIKVDKTNITITSSIGISIFPEDGETEELLINNASNALNNAKIEGRNRYKYYTKEMNVRAFERLSLEANLHRAIEEKQFELFYQPKMSLTDSSVYGAEALIRWQHPDLGLISPAEFIPIAESTGLVIPIGEWVIEESAKQWAIWKKKGIILNNLSINLSSKHVHDKNLVKVIVTAFRENNIDPSCFEIEVTESMVMDNVSEVIPILNEIRTTGIEISIDDFGTGYSSLSYLKKLPINTIKIDQSFVRDLHTNNDDKVIVDAIIALSKSMQLKVIAEGVEHLEQAEMLKAKGCNIVQGFYYSRPINAEDFENWYAEMLTINKKAVVI